MGKYEMNDKYIVVICPKCGWISYIRSGCFDNCSCGTQIVYTTITNGKYALLTPDERKEYDAFIREKYTLHSDVFDDELYKKTLEGDFERRLEIETEKREMQTTKEGTPVPKCPICNSTNIHKISATNKVGSVALFGIFAAGHVSKTFKCDNCGAKF